jgi:hypothetical protein
MASPTKMWLDQQVVVQRARWRGTCTYDSHATHGSVRTVSGRGADLLAQQNNHCPSLHNTNAGADYVSVSHTIARRALRAQLQRRT